MKKDKKYLAVYIILKYWICPKDRATVCSHISVDIVSNGELLKFIPHYCIGATLRASNVLERVVCDVVRSAYFDVSREIPETEDSECLFSSKRILAVRKGSCAISKKMNTVWVTNLDIKTKLKNTIESEDILRNDCYSTKESE